MVSSNAVHRLISYPALPPDRLLALLHHALQRRTTFPTCFWPLQAVLPDMLHLHLLLQHLSYPQVNIPLALRRTMDAPSWNSSLLLPTATVLSLRIPMSFGYTDILRMTITTAVSRVSTIFKVVRLTIDVESPHSVVAYPESTEDVVKIVKIASKHRMPITPYSGATNLEGHTRGVSVSSNECHFCFSLFTMTIAQLWWHLRRHIWDEQDIRDPWYASCTWYLAE